MFTPPTLERTSPGSVVRDNSARRLDVKVVVLKKHVSKLIASDGASKVGELMSRVDNKSDRGHTLFIPDTLIKYTQVNDVDKVQLHRS